MLQMIEWKNLESWWHHYAIPFTLEPCFLESQSAEKVMELMFKANYNEELCVQWESE